MDFEHEISLELARFWLVSTRLSLLLFAKHFTCESHCESQCG